MACLEGLPRERFFSQKNISKAKVCKDASEQTTRFLDQCPLHRRDQSGDVWPFNAQRHIWRKPNSEYQHKHLTVRKKRYESGHWGGTFSKDLNPTEMLRRDLKRAVRTYTKANKPQ